MGWRRMPRSFASPPPLHNNLATVYSCLALREFYLRTYSVTTSFIPPIADDFSVFINCFSWFVDFIFLDFDRVRLAPTVCLPLSSRPPCNCIMRE